MDVRGVAAPTGRPPRWLVPLVLLGLLVSGALIAAVLWAGSRGPLGQTAATGQPAPPARSVSPASPDDDGGVCGVGDPYFRGSEPRDDLLHGGGLGMPRPAGLAFGDPVRMPYAFDVALLESPDGETWAGMGAVRIEEPYLTPEQASSTVTACLARDFPGFHLEVTDARAVQIRRTSQAHERTGFLSQEGTSRQFRVLIADTGSPESLAVYVRVAKPGTPAARVLAETEAQLTGI